MSAPVPFQQNGVTDLDCEKRQDPDGLRKPWDEQAEKHNQADFGNTYGLLIQELRLLARAVFVVDKEGVIRYIEVVEELTNEPDYQAALKAAKEAR